MIPRPGPRARDPRGIALVRVMLVCLRGLVFQRMKHGRTQRQHGDSGARAVFIAEAGFNQLLARRGKPGREQARRKRNGMHAMAPTRSELLGGVVAQQAGQSPFVAECAAKYRSLLASPGRLGSGS